MTVARRISLLLMLVSFMGVQARSSVHKRLSRSERKRRRNNPKNRRCQRSPIALDRKCAAASPLRLNLATFEFLGTLTTIYQGTPL
jgi:hypothetical protein